MSDDAVKVHCDMEGGGETCVFPDVHASKMPNIPWRKSGNGWYSSLRGGFKVKVSAVSILTCSQIIVSIMKLYWFVNEASHSL